MMIKNACKQARAVWREVKSLYTREMPTEVHRKAWDKFLNETLTARSLLSLTARLLSLAILAPVGGDALHESEKYLQADGPLNKQLALSLQPIARIAMYCLYALGVLLFFWSLKNRKVTKVLIYYELLYFFVNAALPTKIDAWNSRQGNALLITLNFMLCAFNWWPSLIASQIAILPQAASRVVLFEEDIVEIATATAFTMIWLTFNLLFCHLILSKGGWLFIEAEVNRSGNEQLLNNFEEGIVIFEEKGKEILFHNRAAASQIQKQGQKDHNASFQDQEQMAMAEIQDIVMDCKSKMFAEVDMDKIESVAIDIEGAHKHLNSLKNTQSINDFIEQQRKVNFPPGQKIVQYNPNTRDLEI